MRRLLQSTHFAYLEMIQTSLRGGNARLFSFLLIYSILPIVNCTGPCLDAPGDLEHRLGEFRSNTSDSCTDLCLLPGTHVIQRNLVVRQRACLILRGHVKGGEKQPIVTCGDNIAGLQAPSFNTDDLGFITFRGASRVEIDNVVFEGCPLSLQFFGTEEILVKNAEFRYNIYIFSLLYVISLHFSIDTV